MSVSPSVLTRSAGELARAAVPLAALAAMAALAAGQTEPTHAAETGYLAVLATAALAAVAALAPAPAWELGIGATLAVTAVWVLPPGPGRGAALAAVLLAALAVAAARRLAASLPDLPPSTAVALAFGLQVLLRGELLLSPGLAPRPLVALLGLPLAAGLAAASLARGRGGGPALLALGTAALAGSGFNVAATLGLVALAAGDIAGRPETARWPRAARIAGFAVMLAPIAWEPRAGAVAAACGLALAVRGVVGPALPTLAAVVGLALGGLAALRPLDEALPLLARLPLLVPLLPAVLLRRDREAWLLALASVLAAAGAAHAVPDPTGLTAPLALAVLALGRTGAAPAIQAAWTSVLLGLASLAAAYPWLRPEPALEALTLLGLGSGPRQVAALLAAALALCAIAALLARRRGPEAARRRGALIVGLAAGAVAVAIVAALPPAGRPLTAGEVVLDAARPAWSAEIAPAVPAASAVLVESSLSNSTVLPPGAPVATLRLHDAAGEVFEWTLRAGRDTGEWAAARPDLAPRLEAPAPWLSYVAGSFFGQRYRGRWELPAPRPVVRAEVERRTDLPADLALALYQVEVRP